ncbi:MAG: DUF4912 domain-containing protein, partial [Spirochaetales bacterium]|nr:DUF4912 domain-containing protein [Spirochaetales bacterium]
DASFEALLRVADRYNVDIPDNVTRDELEDLVYEAAEETREEHRRTNNHSVRVEETKYDNRADGEIAADDGEDIELPDSYNETRIVLLLRDPAWAFAYWDLQTAHSEAFRRSDRFEGLLLRVYSLESPVQSISKCRASFDIPVMLHDKGWYIHLPEQESNYRLSLIAVDGGAERLLALSNVVAVPRGTVSNLDPDIDADAEPNINEKSTGDEILAQTGIQDMDLPFNGRRIPQRILDLIDEDLVFN